MKTRKLATTKTTKKESAKVKSAPARRAKAPRPRAALGAKTPAAAPREKKRIDPAALVVDPEQLLAALERGERGEAERAAPPPAEEVPASAIRPRMESGFDFVPPAAVATEALPVNEALHEPAFAAPVLRANETALTTHSGTIVIRRRRAA